MTLKDSVWDFTSNYLWHSVWTDVYNSIHKYIHTAVYDIVHDFVDVPISNAVAVDSIDVYIWWVIDKHIQNYDT